MATEETRRKVAHLLRRAGLGGPPEEIERLAGLGVEGAVDELLGYERVPDRLEETFKQVSGSLLDISTLEDAQSWWLYRLLYTPRPLEEKMTLFWHGLFATGNQKVQNPAAMHLQNHLLRRHATGNVRRLVLEISQDPAMQLWLDNNTNRKAAPNENYARELLELFTLGIGNYSEADVQAVARAFTGWNLAGPQRAAAAAGSSGMTPPAGAKPGAASPGAGGMSGSMAGGPAAGGGPLAARYGVPSFFFNSNQHDYGSKTILGRTGAWNGDDAIDIILAQPAHATFLTTRLFRFFVHEAPEPAAIAPLARLYTESRLEIKPVLRTLFLSEAFYAERAYSQHVKSPVELVVGAIRSLELEGVRVRSLLPALAAMGQELYNPPNVGGWPGGRAWLNPAALIERFNTLARLVALTGRQPHAGGLFDVAALVKRRGLTGWEQAIDYLYGAVSDRPLSPALRTTLLTYTGGAPLEERTLDMKLRGLAQLVLTSAEGMTA
jgi:uncharacterized protein (DUF1800 family)